MRRILTTLSGLMAIEAMFDYYPCRSRPKQKQQADFQSIEDLRKKQRKGETLNFYEKQRIRREDEENRKKKAVKKRN